MLKKLDWYIIKKMISTTVFMLVIFSIIAGVVDASEKADDFVKSGQSGLYILTHYFAGFIPFIISMIFPLMVFLAVIMFTSKMAGRSEIVAMLAGGIKYNRILRPYLVGAFIVGGTFWYSTQFLIPKANVLMANFKSTYIDSKSSYEIGQYLAKGSDVYLRVDSNTYAGMKNYDTTSKTAYGGFFLDRLKGENVVYNLRAQTLKWDTAKKMWKMERVTERYINGLYETVKDTVERFMNLNVKPADIRFDKYLKDKMTTPELKRYIKLEQSRGTEGLNDYRVELYKRDATPFSVILLTLMGAIVGSRKTRGGSGLHMAVGIVLAACYVIMDKFSLTFSTKGNLHPFIAAWIPNAIFLLVALYLYL
ncbi:MAG: LptF/LptG family permease, partial [Chitinophagaceae bacterium]|nr:LptF/LptG family permease [Chitinophagaceae bacterium]